MLWLVILPLQWTLEWVGVSIANVYKWSDEKHWLYSYMLCMCVCVSQCMAFRWCNDQMVNIFVGNVVLFGVCVRCACVSAVRILQFVLECSMTMQLTRKSTFNFQQAIGFSVKFVSYHIYHHYYYTSRHHSFMSFTYSLDVISLVYMSIYIYIYIVVISYFNKYIRCKHLNKLYWNW